MIGRLFSYHSKSARTWDKLVAHKLVSTRRFANINDPLHTGPRAGTCGRGVYLQPDASVTFSQAIDDAGAQSADALSFTPVRTFHDNRFNPEAQYDGM